MLTNQARSVVTDSKTGKDKAVMTKDARDKEEKARKKKEETAKKEKHDRKLKKTDSNASDVSSVDFLGGFAARTVHKRSTSSTTPKGTPKPKIPKTNTDPAGHVPPGPVGPVLKAVDVDKTDAINDPYAHLGWKDKIKAQRKVNAADKTNLELAQMLDMMNAEHACSTVTTETSAGIGKKLKQINDGDMWSFFALANGKLGAFGNLYSGKFRRAAMFTDLMSPFLACLGQAKDVKLIAEDDKSVVMLAKRTKDLLAFDLVVCSFQLSQPSDAGQPPKPDITVEKKYTMTLKTKSAVSTLLVKDALSEGAYDRLGMLLDPSADTSMALPLPLRVLKLEAAHVDVLQREMVFTAYVVSGDSAGTTDESMEGVSTAIHAAKGVLPHTLSEEVQELNTFCAVLDTDDKHSFCQGAKKRLEVKSKDSKLCAQFLATKFGVKRIEIVDTWYSENLRSEQFKVDLIETRDEAAKSIPIQSDMPINSVVVSFGRLRVRLTMVIAGTGKAFQDEHASAISQIQDALSVAAVYVLQGRMLAIDAAFSDMMTTFCDAFAARKDGAAGDGDGEIKFLVAWEKSLDALQKQYQESQSNLVGCA